MPPPKGLGAAEKRLWRAITASRPPNWFDAGTAPLLKAYVTLAARLDGMDDPMSPAARRATMVLCTLATKLRLAVSSRQRQDDGRRGGPRSHLLGGGAISLEAHRKR